MSMNRFFVFIGLAIALSSCGAHVQKTEVKTFVLGLKDSDTSYKPLVRRMIEDYNTNVGFRALEFADSMDSANCPILITQGLEKRDGKVGWGQWFSSTERSGVMVPVSVPGAEAKETIRYTMQVEFDQDFLTSNNKDENGALNMEIRKLFAHEVGHGFQLQHAPEERDVMYYDISGDKDFASYWPRIREFFAPE